MMAHRCELCAGCLRLHNGARREASGYLWEIVEDRCGVCAKYIGDTLRFLLVRVYEGCARVVAH
jgi:hypothetical protein